MHLLRLLAVIAGILPTMSGQPVDPDGSEPLQKNQHDVGLWRPETMVGLSLLAGGLGRLDLWRRRKDWSVKSSKLKNCIVLVDGKVGSSTIPSFLPPLRDTTLSNNSGR